VLVSDRLKNGKPSKRQRVCAAFILDVEAFDYAKQLRKEHPTWVISVRYGVSR
jgi:hypothetical protein